VDELIAFLLARYDEHEAALARVTGRRFYACDDGHVEEAVEQWADDTDRLPNHHNTWALVLDPDQLLAELATKRSIVERYAFLAEHGDTGDYRWVLIVLAAAYADHPDYQPEWRPQLLVAPEHSARR
jgi:hypothetical protein